MALAAEIKCLHCQRYGGEKPRKAAQAINNMFWMPSEDWLKCFPLRSANIYQNARFRQRLSVCLCDVFLRSGRCERYDMNWKLQWNVDKIINHDMCSSLSLFCYHNNSRQQGYQPQLLHSLVSDLINVFQLMECPVCMEVGNLCQQYWLSMMKAFSEKLLKSFHEAITGFKVFVILGIIFHFSFAFESIFDGEKSFSKRKL